MECGQIYTAHQLIVISYHFLLIGLQRLIADMEKNNVEMTLFLFLRVCVCLPLLQWLPWRIMVCRFYTVLCLTLLSVMRRLMPIGNKFVTATPVVCHYYPCCLSLLPLLFVIVTLCAIDLLYTLCVPMCCIMLCNYYPYYVSLSLSYYVIYDTLCWIMIYNCYPYCVSPLLSYYVIMTYRMLMSVGQLLSML